MNVFTSLVGIPPRTGSRTPVALNFGTLYKLFVNTMPLGLLLMAILFIAILALFGSTFDAFDYSSFRLS